MLASPSLSDTDGDQFDDNAELFERFRNPRIADLPRFSIEPGNAFVTLNEVFSYTDSTGEEVTTDSSSTAAVWW